MQRRIVAIDTADVTTICAPTPPIIKTPLITSSMSNLKSFLAILLIGLLSFSCSNKQQQITIEGSFKNAPNVKIKLALITEDDRLIIDSTNLKDGHFVFNIHANNEIEKARLSAPMLYQLILSYDNTLTTLAQGGDHITITADAQNMAGTYQVQGGTEAVLMGQLDSALAAFVQPTEALYTIYQENIDNDSIRGTIEQDYVQLLDKHKTFLSSFIKGHPNNMASYVAFYQSYNRHSFFSEENDFELLKSITKNLITKYPNHPYLKKMQQRVEVLELIEQRKEQK